MLVAVAAGIAAAGTPFRIGTLNCRKLGHPTDDGRGPVERQQLASLIDSLNVDIMALQEVITAEAAYQIASLCKTRWNVIVSDPSNTIQRGGERYAFFWRNDTAAAPRLVSAARDPDPNRQYSRPAFAAVFDIPTSPQAAWGSAPQLRFTLMAMHAIYGSSTSRVASAAEVGYLPDVFKRLAAPTLPFAESHVMIVGDYNCQPQDTDCVPAYAKVAAANIKWLSPGPTPKTTVGMTGANLYDNFFATPAFAALAHNTTVHIFDQKLPFTQPPPCRSMCTNWTAARLVTDHRPVVTDFTVADAGQPGEEKDTLLCNVLPFRSGVACTAAVKDFGLPPVETPFENLDAAASDGSGGGGSLSAGALVGIAVAVVVGVVAAVAAAYVLLSARRGGGAAAAPQKRPHAARARRPSLDAPMVETASSRV